MINSLMEIIDFILSKLILIVYHLSGAQICFESNSFFYLNCIPFAIMSLVGCYFIILFIYAMYMQLILKKPPPKVSFFEGRPKKGKKKK